MIYYTTLPLAPESGHEAQGIDEAIALGLKILNAEAGVPVILTDVIPMVIPGDKPVVCVTILAKPYNVEALTINEVRERLQLPGILPVTSDSEKESYQK